MVYVGVMFGGVINFVAGPWHPVEYELTLLLMASQQP